MMEKVPMTAGGYAALQVELKKTTSYGLTFIGSYTYSKSLDEQSDPYGGTGIQNSYNLINSYGPSDYDIRQLFVFSSVYALPVGKRGIPRRQGRAVPQ